MSDTTKIALCYVRQSYTRDPNDTNSPDRQKSNIQAICDRHGWTPEWYVDAEGHKSGRNEVKRPGWLALKARIPASDVIALVANDLARLHRKAWHVGRTMELLDRHGVRLVLAAPGRDLDTSTPAGRMLISFLAMQDEAYANDVSQRAQDSVAYRKSRGITVGIPPFGTLRDDDGYLVPSPQGAWLLPSGKFVAGEDQDDPPEPDAIWRGYYDCAHRILQIYSQNKYGYNRISQLMTEESWVFRDRWNKPRLISSDDIQRVTSNWREYAGLVLEGKSRDRVAAHMENPADILYDTGRAVFPLELLRKVAKVQEKRSISTRPTGSVRNAHQYALIRLLYCAHCEDIARNEENPKRRSRLSGTNQKGKLRYRHAEGVRCGSKSRSVRTHIIEDDVYQLVSMLTLKSDAMASMVDLALQVEHGADEDVETFTRKKCAAIAKHKRRIQAARFLFEDGDLTREEYLQRKEENQRMIAHWEARTTDSQKKAIELGACLETVNRLIRLWPNAKSEERQVLARGLFEYIVYDLDTRQISDFRLHAWADNYLVLRAAMSQIENQEGAENEMVSDGAKKGAEEIKNRSSSTRAIYSPNGLQDRKSLHLDRIEWAVRYFLTDLNRNRLIYTGRIRNKKRDALIRQRYADGQSISDLAREYGISAQRIWQIVKILDLSRRS